MESLAIEAKQQQATCKREGVVAEEHGGDAIAGCEKVRQLSQKQLTAELSVALVEGDICLCVEPPGFVHVSFHAAQRRGGGVDVGHRAHRLTVGERNEVEHAV